MGKKRAIASRKGAAAAQTVSGRNDSFEALFLGFTLHAASSEEETGLKRAENSNKFWQQCGNLN